MRLHPRQYVLIFIVLCLGAYNVVRIARARHVSDPSSTRVLRSSSSIWVTFDHAAAVRDGDESQFEPALSELTQEINGASTASPQTPAGELSDLHGCQTWLLFYRQEVLHPSSRAGWRDQTLGHVTSCMKNHADTAK